tara:strand:+ start:10137 stop:10817 length:681 start_codon:yes stop_codon:yes gene_type:complete
MIIGSGLIASSFNESIDLFNDCVIFASGVSSSKETSDLEFKRETNLMLKTLTKHSDLKFIYFTTILAGITNNSYYDHKQEMENLIKTNSNNYLIIKLPQVIGERGNQDNLVNFLKNSIINGDKIPIYKNVSRSIIDVDDVTSIVYNIKNKVTNKTIYISGFEKIKVLQICKAIGRILKIKPKIVLVDNCNYDDWSFENTDIVNESMDKLENNRKGYIKRVLKKYIQ